MAPTTPNYLEPLSPEAFASLGSMEGTYDPIVEVRYLEPLSAEAFASFGSMEGLAVPAVPTVAAPVPAARAAPAAAPTKPDLLWPGFVAATVAAVAAYAVHYAPFAPFTVAGDLGIRHPISAAIIAIIVGVAARNLFSLPPVVVPGCKKLVKKAIPIAIVFSGAGLNLIHIAGVGPKALGITVVCIVIAVAAAYYFGRLFGLGRETALLIGAGTGICGNSAIVAVAPLIDAKDEDLVLSIGTINLFGLVGMLVCPLIGTALHLGDESFGVWSGTTIHAVPQVVAAGFAYSPDAGALATLVKLVRVTFLAPLVAILAVVYARRHTADAEKGRSVVVHYARFVPWFVWGFVALAVLNTLGLIPTLAFHPSESLAGAARRFDLSLASELKRIAKILLTLAMAAIGLELNIRVLVTVGGRALTTGLAAWLVVAGASLALVMLLI